MVSVRCDPSQISIVVSMQKIVSYTEAIDITQLFRNEVTCAILTMVEVKRFYKPVFFFQILLVRALRGRGVGLAFYDTKV